MSDAQTLVRKAGRLLDDGGPDEQIIDLLRRALQIVLDRHQIALIRSRNA